MERRTLTKSIISMALCLVILASLIPLATVTSYAYSAGDLNNDNKYNAVDAALMTREILGMDVPNLVKQVGDINHDEKVNSVDMSLLKKAILGSYVISDEKYNIEKLTLGGIDISEYSIVLPSEYPFGSFQENAMYAGDILSRYIKKACGIKMNIVNSAAGNCIIFKYDADLGTDAFTINVLDGQVEVLCGLSRGPMYAAFGIAENLLGFWFYPKDVVVQHTESDVSFESGYTHTEGTNTSLKYRDSYTYGIVVNNYIGANNEAYKESTLALHNTSNWANYWKDSPKYGYSYGPEHAHSFERLMPGKDRGNGKYCLTDQDNINLCVDNLCKKIDAMIASGLTIGVNFPIISISQSDSDAWCLCRTCSKVVREHGQANSATLIDFLIKVINEVTPKYPGVEFDTLAYWVTIKAPTGFELPDNLYITFAPICHCVRHSIGDYCSLTTCPTTSYNNTAYILDWLNLTDNIFYWWYGANFFQSLVYLPELTWIYESVTYLNSVGIKGSFYQNDDQYVTFSDLQYYMADKIMWNPDMTKEEYFDIVRQACIDYYGSEKVYDLLMIYEDSRDDGMWSDVNISTMGIHCLDDKKILEQYDNIYRLIDEIRAEVTDKDCLARFNRAVIGLQFDLLTETHTAKYVNGTESEREIYTARYKEMYDTLVALKGSYSFVCEGEQTGSLPDTFDPSIRPTQWYKN